MASTARSRVQYSFAPNSFAILKAAVDLNHNHFSASFIFLPTLLTW